MRLHLPTNILHYFPFILKVQGDDGPFSQNRSFFTHFLFLGVLRRAELGVSPAPQYTMPNKKTEGEAMIIS